MRYRRTSRDRSWISRRCLSPCDVHCALIAGSAVLNRTPGRGDVSRTSGGLPTVRSGCRGHRHRRNQVRQAPRLRSQGTAAFLSSSIETARRPVVQLQRSSTLDSPCSAVGSSTTLHEAETMSDARGPQARGECVRALRTRTPGESRGALVLSSLTHSAGWLRQPRVATAESATSKSRAGLVAIWLRRCSGARCSRWAHPVRCGKARFLVFVFSCLVSAPASRDPAARKRARQGSRPRPLRVLRVFREKYGRRIGMGLQPGLT
jgi:hypothetical protein